MAETNIVAFIRRSDGTGTLVRLAVKVDAETEGTLLWDADFAFSIGQTEAEELGIAIPAAPEHRARATDGQGSTVVKFRPSQDAIRLSLTDADGETVLDAVSAKVRHLELRVTEKVQLFLARVRLQAQPAEAAGALCACLGRVVGIVADPQQQELPLARPSAPQIGSVICAVDSADRQMFGLFRGEVHDDRGSALLVDDFGAMHRADRVLSSLRVLDVEGEQVQRYAARCREIGVIPTWRDLVLALGEHIGASVAVGSDASGWRVTDAIVAAATAKIPELPPEAGDPGEGEIGTHAGRRIHRRRARAES